MTDKTKRCIRLSAGGGIEFRAAVHAAAVMALEEFLHESANLLCLDAVVALRKLIREFDEFDF